MSWQYLPISENAAEKLVSERTPRPEAEPRDAPKKLRFGGQVAAGDRDATRKRPRGRKRARGVRHEGPCPQGRYRGR